MSKHNDAAAACPAPACADQNGVDLWHDAQTAGNVSTVAFIVGGVGLAGAAVLWLTAKPGTAATRVGVGPGGLQLKAVW
jgi:hypothetical protein